VTIEPQRKGSLQKKQKPEEKRDRHCPRLAWFSVEGEKKDVREKGGIPKKKRKKKGSAALMLTEKRSCNCSLRGTTKRDRLKNQVAWMIQVRRV